MQQAMQLFFSKRQFQYIALEQGNYYIKQLEQEIAVVHLCHANEIVLKSWQYINEERQRVQAALEKILFAGQPDGTVKESLPFRFLDVVCVPDEVSEYLRELAELVEGIWFVSERDKQLYVFERQSTKYFEIYDDLQAYISNLSDNHTSKEELWQLIKRVKPVTLFLCILNIIIYCFTAFRGDVYDAEYMYSVGAVTFDSIFFKQEYYRLFSSMFLHYGLSHLVNNMISLICLGTMLEKCMGSIRFGILYISSGLLAGLASVSVEYYQVIMMGQLSYSVSAGASGAMFGVIGGLIGIVLRQKWCSKKGQGHVEIPIRSLIFMAFISLFQGFTTMGVDNAAHVGGMIFGFLLSFLLACKR